MTQFCLSTVFAAVFMVVCRAEISMTDLSAALSQVGTIDVVFIAQQNFPHKIAGYSRSISVEHTSTVYTPTGATKWLHKGSCNSKPTLEFKRPKTIVTLMHDLATVQGLLNAFQATITNCTNIIDPGLFSSENTFLFLAFSSNDTSTVFKTYFNNKEVKRHPKTFGLYSLSSSTITMLRYNLYKDAIEQSAFIPNNDHDHNVMSEAFHRQFFMNNFTFQVTTLPYDVHVTGEYLTEFDNPRKGIKVTGGVEVTMVDEICQRLQCSVEYSNPADFSWGQGESVAKNISGFYKDIYEETAHFAISGVGPDTNRINMARPTCHMETVSSWIYTLVTPNPRPKSRFWSILRPFNFSLWVLVLLSIFIYSLILYAIVNMEEKICDRKISKLSYYLESLWYSLATLSQEHVTEFTNCSVHAYATMLVCGAWLLGIFVVTASYSGSLRAFLITPEMEDAIDTFEQLVETDLTWNLVIYGEQVEQNMAQDPNPSMQEFWMKKDEVPHTDFLYERLKNVYLGKSATLEYGAIIATSIQTAFTLPNGKTLLHVSKDANQLFALYSSWQFHPLNPWFDRFNKQMQSMVEIGLHQHMELSTRYELGQKYLAELKAKGEVTPVQMEMHKIEDIIQEINVEDLGSVFYMLIFVHGVSFFVSMIEVLILFRCTKA